MGLCSSSDAPARSHVDELFDALDYTGTDEITAAEILDWVQHEEYFADVNPRDKAKQLLEILDKDHDNVVSRAEFKSYFSSWSDEDLDKISRNIKSWRANVLHIRPCIRRLFGALDKHKDGRVTVSELQEWVAHSDYWATLNARDKAEQLMRLIDENKDSHVEIRELEDFFRRWTDDQVSTLTDSYFKFCKATERYKAKGEAAALLKKHVDPDMGAE